MTKIYHYTKLATAIRYILPSMQLRTNSLSKMNDPRENQAWAFGGMNVEYEKIYPETYSESTHHDRMYQLGTEIKETVQAISFVHSDVKPGYENEMMWAHYSENHEGICLEIDQDEFRKEINNARFLCLENMDYSNSSEVFIRWNRRLSKSENINNIISREYKNLFLAKSEYWEKEYEKRLLMISQDQFLLSIQKSLTGIYCGLSMDINFRPSIDRLIDKSQTKIYDLYYEGKQLKRAERQIGDYRPFINSRYN